MKKAFIHFGLHKTGTTSIQSFFGANRSILKNVIYPVLTHNQYKWFNHSIPLYNLFCSNSENYHQNIKLGICSTEISTNVESQLKTTLDSKYDVLLSGEALSLLSENDMKYMNQYFNNRGYIVHVIAYAREPYAYFTSSLQQSIKSGGSIESFRIKIDYHDKLENIFSSFENVQLFSYDHVLATEPDYITHFINAAQIEFLNPPISTPKRNQSLSQFSARLLSSYNGDIPKLKQMKAFSEKEKTDNTRLLHQLSGGGNFRLTQPELEQHVPFLEGEIKYLTTLGFEMQPIYKPASKYKSHLSDRSINKHLIDQLDENLQQYIAQWACKESHQIA